MVKVKKAGANRGRLFYGCSHAGQERCDFFMWVDENPRLVTLAADRTRYPPPLQALAPPPSSTPSLLTPSLLTRSLLTRSVAGCRRDRRAADSLLPPQEAWARNALRLYMDRLRSLDKASLHEEFKRCVSRNRLGGAAPAMKGSRSMSIAQCLELLRRNAQAVLGKQSGLARGLCREGEHTAAAATYDDDDDDDDDEEELEIGVEDDDGGDSSDNEDDSDDGDNDDNGGIEQGPPASDAVSLALRGSFGFSAYRPGQRWAVDRCLRSQSSLLVMPTGAGKSLCYMLPAMLLPGVTVVVSPLIALMQDQMQKLPVHLPGAVMGGKMSTYEMTRVSADVLDGVIKVLFVSPERLCSQPFRSLVAALHASRGPAAVSLLCVDEAHCLSQWSYNFRPAFLRIRRELQLIQPACVLALTATAPPKIQREIMVRTVTCTCAFAAYFYISRLPHSLTHSLTH